MAQSKFRPYKHKEIQELKINLDPVRIKIRVLPVSAGCQPKGMNADFYFREAGKKALMGNLTQALDLLKRGLTMKPDHYQCRFNHGVILFKFGLIKEAIDDFKRLTDENPRMTWPKFNLAISLIQMGVPKRLNQGNKNNSHGNRHHDSNHEKRPLLNGSANKKNQNSPSAKSTKGKNKAHNLNDLPDWLSTSDIRYEEAIL